MHGFQKCCAVLLLCFLQTPAISAEKIYSFGVISQRSPHITAQYWNPVLSYLTRRTGMEFELKLTKTGAEHAKALCEGAYDFIYSNHHFTAAGQKHKYKVIARPDGPPIHGQLIVMSSSEVYSMADLDGQDIAFPSQNAFVGYHVPMEMIRRAGVNVNKAFAGNQDGAIGQLVTGRVVAAGVNSQFAAEYSERNRIYFRTIWNSEPYFNIPIAVHPSIPAQKVKLIRNALVGMAKDEEGLKILKASADIIMQSAPYGFIASNDKDYSNVVNTYKNSETFEGAQ